MSPSAAAPSSASQIACSRTSASEWPARPLWNGISTPPTTSFRPAANAWTSRPWPILMPPSFSSRERGLGDGEVLGECDLQVLAASGDKPWLQPKLLDGARLVGPMAGRAVQRAGEQPGTEHLRRLREPELRAVLGPGDALHAGLVLRRPLHRVGRGQREQAADFVGLALAQQAFQVTARQARPRRVVHQDPVLGLDG